MRTLHSGPNLHLTLHGDKLILNLKNGGHLSQDQIALIESKGMQRAGKAMWSGSMAACPEIVRTVESIDRDWVSREDGRRAIQQIIGGR